jgi:DHA1 family bicyclomycin/chloramphenicol resistance-like MFS transporter
MNQTTNTRSKSGIKEFEFIALMAFLMSNVALSIDAILPALPNIGLALEVADSSRLQLIVTMIFLGLGLGELVFGTLSDSFGRKPIVYAGVIVFVLASLMIVFAPSLEVFLIGRVIQGMGLSAARSVSVAIIRDTYQGDRMARVMSFIMTIFILVPMLAPMLGQLILNYYNWQAIFYFQLIFIGITIIWFWLRQRETLVKEKRIPISKHLFINGLREYFKHKDTVLYTFISGLIQGSFITYLGSAQQIFQQQYQMVDEFPYIFGGLAFTMGVSALLNGVLVVKYGMLRLVNTSLYIFIITSLLYLFFFMNTPNPNLTLLLVFLSVQFFSTGFISGNLSSLAMQPIGHIAGVGAAISSFMSMTLAVLVAIVIGHFIENTVVPIFVGFFISGVIALVFIRYIRGKMV